jgi:hypothetical protein
MGIPLNTDSTLKGQTIFLAERASELMCDNIITDRTIIDVMAFASASKSMNILDKDAFTDFASHLISEYDHIFYVSPEGIEIEDNGVRETDAEYRDLIDFTILNIINRFHHLIKKYHNISGSTEERIALVKHLLSL